MSSEHYKICSCCKELKPLSDYGTQSKTEDGHRSDCEKCCEKLQKIYEETRKYKENLGILRNPKMSKSELKFNAYSTMHKREKAKPGYETLPKPSVDLSGISIDDLLFEYYRRVMSDDLTKMENPRKGDLSECYDSVMPEETKKKRTKK